MDKTLIKFERSTPTNYGTIYVSRPKCYSKVYLVWPDCPWSEYVKVAQGIRREIQRERAAG